MTPILFAHLPKTAGRSIRFWLAKELGSGLKWFRGGNILYSKEKFQTLLAGGKLNNPRDYFRAKVIGGHDAAFWHADLAGWREFEAITILRDPAERMYSQYQHFSRKGEMPPGLTFPEWAGGEYTSTWGLCHCLWCYYKPGNKHKSNPMAWFYAARTLIQPPDNPLEAARDFLQQAKTYRMDQVGDAVTETARLLEISAEGYSSFDITGSGASIPDDYRKLVAKSHPLDYLLWEEFGG